MNLSVVLRESGLTPEDYDCAKIPITLYNRKDRILKENDIRFTERLFSQNDKSFKDFYLSIKALEKLSKKTLSINVRIDEYNVILFYKSPNAWSSPVNHPWTILITWVNTKPQSPK